MSAYVDMCVCVHELACQGMSLKAGVERCDATTPTRTTAHPEQRPPSAICPQSAHVPAQGRTAGGAPEKIPTAGKESTLGGPEAPAARPSLRQVFQAQAKPRLEDPACLNQSKSPARDPAHTKGAFVHSWVVPRCGVFNP